MKSHSRKAAGEDAYTDEAPKKANGSKRSNQQEQLRKRPSAALENQKKNLAKDLLHKGKRKVLADAILEQSQPKVEKPSNEVAGKPLFAYYSIIGEPPTPQYWFKRDDIVAAVKKHKQRFFLALDNMSECERCRRSVVVLDSEDLICYNCAVEEDFGKVD